MGRKEDRKRNRALGINKQKMPSDPFEMSDGTLVFPVDSAEGGTANLGFLSPSEFFKTTAALSDREMNRLIYNQVKHGANHIGDKQVLYSHLTSDHETLTMGNEDRKKQNYIVLRL